MHKGDSVTLSLSPRVGIPKTYSSLSPFVSITRVLKTDDPESELHAMRVDLLNLYKQHVSLELRALAAVYDNVSEAVDSSGVMHLCDDIENAVLEGLNDVEDQISVEAGQESPEGDEEDESVTRTVHVKKVIKKKGGIAPKIPKKKIRPVGKRIT